MQRINIIAVGKVKERFFTEAIHEYEKRIGRFARLDIIEVQDEKTPENASEAVNRQIREKEGERILKNIRGGSYVIAMAIEGKMYDSLELSDHIRDLGIRGQSHLTFIIGGSLGLSDQVLQRADEKISFSKLTFPHQLMRVILLEQIYRSYKIMNHEPYHK